MPFKNAAQRRACYAQRSRDLKQGIKPRWDCKKWEKYKRSAFCNHTLGNGKKCKRKCNTIKCWQHCE